MNPSVSDSPTFKKILSVLLVAGIPFLYCYFAFYTFNHQITHTNLPTAEVISTADTHVAGLNEHDGIERNVLLAMFLIIGPLGYMLYRSKWPMKLLMAVGAVLWLVFFLEMHFFANLLTPLASGEKLRTFVEIVLLFAGTSLVWKWLYGLSPFVGRLVIAECIILCCFIPFGDISYYDYSYIMAPALKVMQTGKFSSAFFQYDILPSIPAMFILKRGGGPYDYRIVGQASMFMFFVASFVVGRRFFTHKSLAFLLVAMMLIVRLFMNLNDVTNAPQVTSIRLDWWLLLFAAAYWWGLNDFKLGLCLLFLLVLLNSFGVIYFVCWLLLIGFLLLLQIYNNYMDEGTLPNTQVFTGWFKTYAANIGLGLGGLALHWLITGNVVNESVSIYGAFQLGMLPVLQDSLYWYFGAVFAFSFALLLIFKNRFNDKYWNAALLLLFLFVGNSIYFFGRSHENNIVNITGSLLFVVVLCSDVLLQLFTEQGHALNLKQKAVAMAPFAFIFFVVMLADANLFAANTKSYKDYIDKRFPPYTQSFPSALDLQVIGDVTHNSKKVYFMIYGGSDFFLYYRGNYDIPSKFMPIDTWMLKSEKIAYANKLIEQGYYVVAVKGDDIFKQDFLPYLKYKNVLGENVYVSYSNN